MSLKLDRRAFIGAALTFGAIASVSPKQALGVTAAQKKAEVQSVKAKLDSMSDEVEEAAEKYNDATVTYNKATAEVTANQKKIAQAESKIKNLQGHLETRAKAMYRNGSMSYMSVLMGTNSMDDFVTAWDTLNNLNEDDADLVASTKVAKQELETAKKNLVAKQNEAQSALASAREYKASAEQKQAAYEREYNSLSSEYKRLVKKEQEAEEAAAARAARAYQPAGNTSGSSSSSGGSSSSHSSSGSSSSHSSGASSGSSGSHSSGGSSGSSGSSGSAHYGGSNAAVRRAYSCLGKPYRWGAVGPGSYDCSGLVSYCISGSHTRIYTASELAGHARCAEVAGAPVSCNSHHCGLCIGGGRMIHAPHTGAVVEIAGLRGHCVVP